MRIVFLILVSSFLSTPSFAGIPNLADVVKNKDGTVRRMSAHEAWNYCELLGKRLPTSTEFATLAVSMGATVRPSNFANTSVCDNRVKSEDYQNRQAEYEMVTRLDESGTTVVDFFLNSREFKNSSPNEENGWGRDNIYWTSSVASRNLDCSSSVSCCSNDPYHLKRRTYLFSGIYGVLFDSINYEQDGVATVCVPN